jgi:hypothetical protein
MERMSFFERRVDDVRRTRRSPIASTAKKFGTRNHHEETTMANQISIAGKDPKEGDRMTMETGWALAVVKGDQCVFIGTLLWTHNSVATNIAAFSVPK